MYPKTTKIFLIQNINLKKKNNKLKNYNFKKYTF